jgi:hypothetical protein
MLTAALLSFAMTVASAAAFLGGTRGIESTPGSTNLNKFERFHAETSKERLRDNQRQVEI